MSVSSLQLSSPPSPLGVLGHLPLEMRRDIYSFAIAAGTALTRTSKAVHQEAAPLLYQSGICGIYVDIHRTTTIRPPSSYFSYWRQNNQSTCHLSRHIPPEVLARVSSIKISVDLVEPCVVHEHESGTPNVEDVLRPILASMRTQDDCHFVFVLANGCEAEHQEYCVRALLLLSGFETVTVEFRMRDWVSESPFAGYREEQRLFRYGVHDDRLDVELVKIMIGWVPDMVPRVRIIRTSGDDAAGARVLWESQYGA